MSGRGPIRRKDPGGFELHLGRSERDAIVGMAEQLRQLLLSETPSSDPSLGRVFPPAFAGGEVLDNLAYEREHAGSLLADKLEALDVLERTADRERITEDELLAWVRSINAMRLVMGSRLDITEESTAEEFADDPATAGLFDAYDYLTWLQSWAIEALSA